MPALKLGELLVRHQLLTDAQLAEGLRSQQMFGGRLGSNLVELGYLSEQALAKFLSMQLGLPAVNASELDVIPDAALRAIPSEVAAKHKVIPLMLAQRKLKLAMADPTDLKAIDEVAFLSGCSVHPVVAPEMLIQYALEKYYGLVRSSRFLRMSSAGEEEFQVVQTAHRSSEASATGAGAAVATGAAVPAQVGTSSNVVVEARDQFLAIDRREFSGPKYTHADARRDLAEVKEQKDVFEVFLRALSRDFVRVALFVVRGAQIVGWNHHGCVLSEADLRRVSIAVSSSAICAHVLDKKVPLVGPTATGPGDTWLAKLLGFTSIAELVAIPIAVNDSVVGVVLANEPRGGSIAERLPDVLALTTRVGFALQMAFLRKRILEG